MKKSILFILPGFTFGGTVFSTLNMISFLKNDYDVSVLPMTYQGPVLKYYQEAEITLLPEMMALSALMGRVERESSLIRKSTFIFHKVLRRLLGIIKVDYDSFVFKKEASIIERRYQFDFVASCQEGGSTYFASCFLRTEKIAWFRSEYSVYKEQLTKYYRRKEQKIYPAFSKIVCVSKTTRDDFALYFPQIAERIFAIHNIQFLDSIKQKASQPIDDPFEPETFNIVSVGRFAPQKRFSSIPKIAYELKNQGLRFSWYIIGDGNMYGEWDKTQCEIQKYNVSDCVKCIGSRLNPYPYIAGANLSVTPSYYEACPRVVIEAKILHTPVVCADFSSASEFVVNDVDGYVDTLDKIVVHIGNLINDPKLYNRIKTQCNQYTIDNNMIYDELCKIFCK